MKKCVILSVIHFLAGVLYGAGALIINEISAPLALMFSLPLSFAMTVFYYSILNGLADTMANLTARRQPLKLLMYQRRIFNYSFPASTFKRSLFFAPGLWRILVFSAIILVLFFIANTVAFKYRTDPAWLPVYWQYRWLLLDGWLNILYLVVYLSIALLWRPTENNQRYGLEQLAGDDYDEEEAGMAAGAAGPGITQPAQRKIHLRTIHTDETLDEEADEEEDEDDVFRWAEENVGREVGSAGGAGVGPGTAGGSGMPRDSSQAGLLDPEEGTGSQKMA
ncbi:hypothetical protein BC830DRAFT_945785 [Chytriomyces sp. MP71]|nr:hypothetical protein BC830DRAFT_945785 [Chytriomyces sp. MP71]